VTICRKNRAQNGETQESSNRDEEMPQAPKLTAAGITNNTRKPRGALAIARRRRKEKE